jgi:hypothetical protein
MPKAFGRSLSIALGALATTTLGGCYYGDVYGASYAGGDCATRYGADYYDYDGYAYDDGYGYDCYDGADYGSGFAQIGFGGGWYDNYYYPGYGMWLFDSYRNRYPLRGQYLDYWGGRRAWWKHHGGKGNGNNGNWNGPGRGDGNGDGRPGRPGNWNGQPGRGDGNGDGRPGRPGGWNGRPNDGQPGTPPTTTNPQRPDRGPGTGGTRPWRPDATPGTRPDRPQGGAQRPPRNWSPGATPRGPEVRRPPREAPAGGRPEGFRPAPTPQAAPVIRSAPPPAAPRQAPTERPTRFERPVGSDDRR